MGFLQPAIDFLTNPTGIGFPILIGAGLGIILYLMKITTKDWRKEDTKLAEQKQVLRGRNYPTKPF